jgi:putative transcriptional regulator
LPQVVGLLVPEGIYRFSIRLNLDRVMLERRISLTELAERIGITLTNLSILKTNKARAVRLG